MFALKMIVPDPVKGSFLRACVCLLAALTLNISVLQFAHGNESDTSNVTHVIKTDLGPAIPLSSQSNPDQTTPLTQEEVLSLLRHLDGLGIPVGTPTIKVGAEQIRGLCIAREFAGLKSHRGKPRSSEMSILLQLSSPIDAPKSSVRGLNVSIGCQAAWYVEEGKVMRVMRATTGTRPGWTPTGTFKVTWRTKGWTYSTIYKDARLYKIHHFKGAVGFHGVASPSWIKTKPASHGCVRLSNNDMDWLETRMPPGSLVRVYGSW